MIEILLQMLDIPYKLSNNPEADVFADCLNLLTCKEMKVCFDRRERQVDDEEAEAALRAEKKMVKTTESKQEVGGGFLFSVLCC